MRLSTLLIAVLSAFILGLSVLLAVGCGGSSDSGTGGETTSAQKTNASQQGETSGESSESESSESESQTEAGSSGASLTKAAFIKAGDAICLAVPKDFQSRFTSLEEERKATKKGKATVAEVANVAAIPPIQTAVVKFKVLKPPAGDEQKAEGIVAALENAAKELEKKPTGELSGPKSPFWEFQQLTKAYGFKSCSKL